MTVHKISDLIEALVSAEEFPATVREASPGEEPDLPGRRFDKECTGVLFGKRGAFKSVTFNPPVLLRAGVAYMVVRSNLPVPPIVDAPKEGER